MMPKLVIQAPSFPSLGGKPAPPPQPEYTTAQKNLQQTVRALWVASYCLLWVGLVPRGWQRADFNGVQLINGQEFHQTSIAYYGLWDVQYQLTTGTANVPYNIWAGSQVDRKPLAMVQLTQAFMLFAAISGAFVFLAHVRGFCSRTKEAERRFDWLAAFTSLPQLVFSTLSLLTWKSIPRSAFTVFCTANGCVSEPPANVRVQAASYGWVFVLVAAILSLFLTALLFRLVTISSFPADDPTAMAPPGGNVELPGITAITGLGGSRRRAPSDQTRGSSSNKSGSVGSGSGVDYVPVAKVGDAAGPAPNNKRPTNPAAPWLDGV